ncbi:MAG: AAA family ATPase, partial [Proteobacteria bacterium]|nr:AAA family ATPase [Pseudomonadota bacterium]
DCRKIAKELGQAPRTKTAATQNGLDVMLATCDDSLEGRRDRALLLFGWSSGGRRRSEIAAAEVRDLEWMGADTAIFRMRRSKTGDSGPKPVKDEAAVALREWLAAAKVTEGALFRRLWGPKVGERLSAHAIAAIVKRRAAQAGLPGDFAGHSLRRGFVTEAGLNDIPLAQTMAMTGHRDTSKELCAHFQREIRVILVSAKVGPFRSMNTPQTVAIDAAVTVFVGMNEAGKTVLLKALQKSSDALGDDSFAPVEDYPRKDLSAYLKTHKTEPAAVTELTYALDSDEVDEINTKVGTTLKAGHQVTVTSKYDNNIVINLSVDEQPLVKTFIKALSTDASAALSTCKKLRAIPALLADVSLTESDTAALTALSARLTASKWDNVAQWETWAQISSRRPKFLYFSDYDLLPGKMNLADLANRVEQAKSDPKHLKPSHRSVLALLRMADVPIADLTTPSGYEELKAKIEAVSIRLTDQVMEFWKQNEDLEVEVDIKADPSDEAPFNSGSNLYLRIKNRRHRGVSTPFDQRSRGFIWFFSFLVWFDSVQHQLDPSGKSAAKRLILLLDEPGLALHALAQADFLRYIDRLAKDHQVLYTTHSPFMVHSDRLHQVRIVEDQLKLGTVISENLGGSDPRTIFPLQAALGWTVAQNLFISERNLLVEGPSELIYLQAMSGLLEADDTGGLRDDVTIVP